MRSLLALLLFSAVTFASGGERRPNVLLFLVDDLGWQDLSLPLHSEETPFNRRYRTPNVERLAARGVRFTQGYASAPVCTPTRTSLMTGRSPARNHITYWTLNADRDQSAAYPGVGAPRWNVNALQPGDVTLPRLLQGAGYRTIHVGKAHLGAKGTPGEDPRNLGFDVNVAGHGAGGPGSFLGTENFSAAHRGGGRVWDVPGLEAYHGQEIFLTEALTREALAALESAVAEGRPFFLQMAPYAVHAPITANGTFVENYAGLDAREAAYASMIETVDASLGALVEALERLGVLEDTLVVFTSDNGGLSAHGRGGAPHVHNAPLRSGKGSAYEGGVRVPWIVAGPGVRDTPRRCDVPVITHDLFPTLLAAAGVEVPAAHRATLDGRDLTPLLAGKGPLRPRALLWHQPHFWGVQGPGIWPYSGLRLGSLKLLYRHAERDFELYDLSRDLGETHDLAGERPAEVRRLARVLEERLRACGAQLSIDLTTGEPIPGPLGAFEALGAARKGR